GRFFAGRILLRGEDAMFRHFLPLLAGLLAVVLARAEDKPTPPTEDFQELVWMEGQRIGTARYSVAALDEDGLILRTTQVLELNLRRYGTLVRLRKEESTSETRDGKVLALSMKQGQAGGKQMILEGAREGNLMHIRVDAELSARSHGLEKSWVYASNNGSSRSEKSRSAIGSIFIGMNRLTTPS
ncbi:MAG: hypothetical protein ACKO23_05935, partial [Gemmataceae bacterium]